MVPKDPEELCSTLAQVESFEKSVVWQDIRKLIDLRLQDNFKTFLKLDLSNEQIRSLQGSTLELYSVLDLPFHLRGAIETQIEELENGKT